MGFEAEFDFEFDKWAELANSDPNAFEEQRCAIIKRVIDSICLEKDRRRALEGLQFRINMERRRSKTPMESCVRLSSMMKDQFLTNFYPLLKNFHEMDELEHPVMAPVTTTRKADVIPLRRSEKIADRD